MGGQHVVVGRHDGDVDLGIALQRGLLVQIAGGEAMREIAARERAPLGPALGGRMDVVEVGPARLCAALGDAFGDLEDAGVHGMLAFRG
jgi:hypothetical protein